LHLAGENLSVCFNDAGQRVDTRSICQRLATRENILTNPAQLPLSSVSKLDDATKNAVTGAVAALSCRPYNPMDHVSRWHASVYKLLDDVKHDSQMHAGSVPVVVAVKQPIAAVITKQPMAVKAAPVIRRTAKSPTSRSPVSSTPTKKRKRLTLGNTS